MSLINDPDLKQLLADASAEDLGVLADFITDKGEGRLSLSNEVRKRLHSAREQGVFSANARALIAEELTRFGGNSVMNLLRGGEGVPYREVVTDVASHLGVLHKNDMSTGAVELAMLAKLLHDSLEKMTPKQLKEALDELGLGEIGAGEVGLAAFTAAVLTSELLGYRLAAMMASASATAILGRAGFAAGATLIGGRAAAFVPVIGWAITGIWAIYDLSSPAYRVTVPCVIQLAYMRNKPAVPVLECAKCAAPLDATARFCSQCGTPVPRLLLK